MLIFSLPVKIHASIRCQFQVELVINVVLEKTRLRVIWFGTAYCLPKSHIGRLRLGIDLFQEKHIVHQQAEGNNGDKNFCQWIIWRSLCLAISRSVGG